VEQDAAAKKSFPTDDLIVQWLNQLRLRSDARKYLTQRGTVDPLAFRSAANVLGRPVSLPGKMCRGKIRRDALREIPLGCRTGNLSPGESVGWNHPQPDTFPATRSRACSPP